jgi:hypothetical protein
MGNVRFLKAFVTISLVWSTSATCGTGNTHDLSEAKARSLAEKVTRTAIKDTHVYPEMDQSVSPGFYQFELHWDHPIEGFEGNQIAAFLLIDKKSGNIFKFSGVTCYFLGRDQQMHEIHPGGSMHLPDICD